jgi:type II secretory pathway predicted ATPase ExeA
MNKKLLALYGLKWNPFSSDIPTEALLATAKIENFCWRIEQALVREGGFALVTGDPGTGKSVALRILAERLATLPDLTVGAIHHPRTNVTDFYCEMGAVLAASRRWWKFDLSILPCRFSFCKIFNAERVNENETLP